MSNYEHATGAGPLHLNVVPPRASGALNFVLVHGSASTGLLGRRAHGAPPPVIPAGQEYYWTSGWQAGERDTLAELEAGNARTFSTADDALRYLLSADD